MPQRFLKGIDEEDKNGKAAPVYAWEALTL